MIYTSKTFFNTKFPFTIRMLSIEVSNMNSNTAAKMRMIVNFMVIIIVAAQKEVTNKKEREMSQKRLAY